MRRPSILAATGLLCVGVPAYAQQFVFTPAAIPAATNNVWTNGVVAADVDGDGDLDLLFANGQGYAAGGARPQHLFLNNGSGTFVAAHANLNVADFNAQMVIAEDFDNDGDLDVMYSPEGAFPGVTQKPRMLINNGAGVFNDQSATRIPNINMASFCLAAGDVDNDGDLDVAITDGGTFAGVATQCRLYENNGNGFFTDATAARMPVDTYNAQDVTFFDWDNDFDVDILLSGKGAVGKRSRLYLNDGAGVYSVSTIFDNTGTGGTYEIDVADLDGDGDQDLVVQSISGSNEGWARNNAFASVTNAVFVGTNGNDDNEMAAFDYDNDGDFDAFVGSLAGNQEKVYNNNGAGVLTYAGGTVQPVSDPTLDIGFGDLNGDRKIDLISAQGETSTLSLLVNKVYYNNGPVDDRDPVLHATLAPASINGSSAAFRARVSDAFHDDGRIPVTARLAYATKDAGAGTQGLVRAIDMGNGTFRAGVPTNAGTTAISYVWLGRDSVGNDTQWNGTELVGAGTDGVATVGTGTAGAAGVPVLAAVGTLGANSIGRLDLVSARPNSTAILFVGLVNGSVPLLGGVLVPFPVIIQVPLITNGAGELGFPFVWQSGVPAGTKVYVQYVVQDAAGPNGVAFSNGIELTAQ
jgi:hypothetical protein